MFGYWNWGWNWDWHWSWAWGWLVVAGALVGLVIVLLIEVLFLLNLRGALYRVSDRNRAMPPNHVWLNLIPIFGLGWFIYTVMKVKDSLQAEYRTRGWAPEGDFGYNIGLAAGILAIASAFWGWIPVRASFLGGVISIAHLVCWIIYWVRIAGVRGRLGPRAAWLGPGSSPPPSQYAPPTTSPATPPATPAATPPATPPVASETGGEPADSPAAGTAATGRQEKRCAVCGTAVAPGDKFCRVCGLPLP